MGSKENRFKILVLRDRWVVWGTCTKLPDGTTEVVNAAVIREWGTKRGLGELAAKGPRPATELDPIGRIVIEPHDLKFTIDCEKDWGAVS